MHVTFDPKLPPADDISFDDFLAVDIRIGEIVGAEDFPQARTPSLKLRLDFGPGVGIKTSSAQIKALYAPEDLLGRQVMAVVNFPARQIGPFISQVLTLGFADEAGRIVLVAPDGKIPNGTRLT